MTEIEFLHHSPDGVDGIFFQHQQDRKESTTVYPVMVLPVREIFSMKKKKAVDEKIQTLGA